MNINIAKTISTRLEAMGMSQAQFAESVSTSPAQMSLFLNEMGSLSMKSINRCLDIVGIDISLYSKRIELAKEVANYLKFKNISSIDNWSKDELAKFTSHKEISLLFDVKNEEYFIELQNSGIIDIESTFLYFKALVSYFLELGSDKPTASKAKQALNKILESGIVTCGLAVANMPLPVILSTAAIFALKDNETGKREGAKYLFSKLYNVPSILAKAIKYIKD